MPWLCESLRLSALWPTHDPASGTLNWQAIVGSDPEQREVQPRLGTTREVGSIWDGRASLEYRASPGRVDWAVTPILPAEMVLVEPPNLGEVKTETQKFAELLFGAVASSYNAPRFALGIVAACPQATNADSYTHLAQLLRIEPDHLKGASDFHYQINRPRPSTTAKGMSINRVSRWSAMATLGLRMQFEVSPTSQPQSSVRTTQPTVYATRAELDINSPAEWRNSIEERYRRPLLEEFANLACEILDRGDVP